MTLCHTGLLVALNVGKHMSDQRRARICVFTGSRADYGPLLPLLRRLNSDATVDLRLVASGGHLVPEQGMTVRAIERDGFIADERIDIVLATDAPAAVCKSFGLACIGYADVLERMDPDVVVVLGDRYESLAMATVTVQMNIALAHIGGGQLSFGSIDDRMRHAISKLADVHFTLGPDDRNRLVQMGENPDRIVHVGMIGLDQSLLETLWDRPRLEDELGIRLRKPTFLITHHPATSDSAGSCKSIDGLLSALGKFPDATLVFTAPNVDNGSQYINRKIIRFADSRPGDRTIYIKSLGQRKYLSLLKHVDLVIGNSSSGLTEAPLLGAHTVNIGSRQEGRSKPESVFDCRENADDIEIAIGKALLRATDVRGESDLEGRVLTEGVDSIVSTLKGLNAGGGHVKKKFFSLIP